MHKTIKQCFVEILFLFWPLFSFLKRIPLFGPLLRRLSWRILPTNTFVQVRILRGPGAGLCLRVDPRYLGYASGEHERSVQEALIACLGNGDIVYDIGAQIGFFSLIAARAVGEKGKVYAFEPHPDNASEIEKNALLNALQSRIKVIPYAVWSQTGRFGFTLKNPSSTTYYDGFIVTDSSMQYAMEVEAVSLDTFVRNNPPPNLVKIDVEGAEIEVLKGAQEMIEHYRPILLVEVHSQENLTEISKLLELTGYTFTILSYESDEHIHILAKPSGSAGGLK